MNTGRGISMVQRTKITAILLLICTSGLVSCSNTDEKFSEALAVRLQMEGDKAQLGNPNQKRVLAIRASKIDAYRSLSEQIYGLYIDSSTTIGDMVVQSDVVQTRVEGIIYGAQVESIKPLSDTTYEVTLSLSSSVVDNLKKLYLQNVE